MNRQRTALIGFALVLGMLPQPASGQSSTGSEPRFTSTAHATAGDDEAPGHSYTSPGVVVDPDDPRVAYAATVDVRNQRCALIRTADGGRSWVRPKSSPSPDAFPFCTHDNGFIPMSFLAMGRDKTLYFSHIGWDTQDGGRGENRSVFVGRSTDKGETWQSTTVRNNRGKIGNDIEKNVPTGLAVDTTSGSQDIVYLTWTASFPNPTSPSRPGQPMLAVSVDGAKTFGEPVNLAGTFYDDAKNLPSDLTDAQRVKANFGGGGASPTVDSRGLWVSWTRGSANITPTPPPTILYMSQSADQGKTLAVSEIQPADVNQFGPTGAFLRWSPSGGPTGSLHAVWEGKTVGTQGDRDVLYRRSTDEGRTWSPPKVLNDDDPAQLYGQFQPRIEVAPDGRLHVAWWDHRDSAGRFVNDVYTTHSNDGGATWSRNVRVTDRSINRTIGMWKPGTGGDVRQPPGIGAAEALTYFVWDDTRNGTDQTETQDLYAATAQFKALSGGGLPRTAGYLLAIVLGVGSVGLILLFTSLAVRGRRAAGSTSEQATSGREPAEVG